MSTTKPKPTHTSHTPGPWTTQGESTLNIISRATPKGRRVCSVLVTAEEDQANARLIAAAPEMLEALEKIEATLDSLQLLHLRAREDHEMIKATLKKARGE